MHMPIAEAPVTHHQTAAGRAIEAGSFAIIDREAGFHPYTPEQWPIVRRLIHASGDFDFNGITVFHPEAVAAGIAAVRGGAAVVADVGMIVAGLSKTRLAHFGMRACQFIEEPALIARAREEGTTIATQAMRHAHVQGLLAGAIVGIGNAPTALIEVIRLIREAGARPALAIGMPVGFVSAVEAKEQLMEVAEIPWIACRGRKGGSALVVAAIHALMALAEAERHREG